MPPWWNGRHKGLKIPRLLSVPVQVRLAVPAWKLRIVVCVDGQNNRLGKSHGLDCLTAGKDRRLHKGLV